MAREVPLDHDRAMEHSDPIRHVVVLGHPTPGSFNHQVADAYCETVRACGQEAILRDLYATGFDPLLKSAERRDPNSPTSSTDVIAELAALENVRALVFVYPVWFGSPPAIIKGYVDRVFGAGFGAREVRGGVAHPLLAGARLITFSSSATTTPWLKERGHISLAQTFDDYLTAVFAMRDAHRIHFDSVVDGLHERFVLKKVEAAREEAIRICATLDQKREHRMLHPAAWPNDQ
jgi:NAD(P)H dehydrogenase (quinone)